MLYLTSDMVNSYLCICVCVDRSQWDEESTVVNLTPEMVNAQFSLVDASLPAEDSKPARLVSLGSASSGRSPLGQHFQLSKQKTKTEDTHTHKNRGDTHIHTHTHTHTQTKTEDTQNKKEEGKKRTHTQIQRIQKIKKTGDTRKNKNRGQKERKKRRHKNQQKSGSTEGQS